MAESFVNVTEGAGKKLHTNQRTIGANTVEDEVIVVGEQYLATYVMTHGPTSVATALSHPSQLMAGASLKLRVRRIRVWQQVAATTAALPIFELLRLSTAGTGGTAVTPNPLEAADGACGATGMTLPTAKGTEGARLAIASPYLIQTIGASTPFYQPVIEWDFDRLRTKAIIVPAGTTNGLALKATTGTAGASVLVEWLFDEANF